MSDGQPWPSDPSALDVLAALDGAVSEDARLDEVARPLLALLARLTGLEAVFLTEVFPEAQVASQELLVVHEGDVFGYGEGDVAAWDDTLCRRCIDEDGMVTTGLDLVWGGPSDAAIATYVVVPIRLPGSPRIGATLCGASSVDTALDARQRAAFRVTARLVGAALWQRRGERLARLRADEAEQRLADRLAFDAKVQHALRTPLSVLRGWATTLRDERLDERLRVEGLDVIERTADRMLRQVGELLGEDRALAGAGPTVVVDVREVVEESLLLAGDRPVTVTGRGRLVGDRHGVALVVEHLLENTAAHTPPGTPVRVELRTADAASPPPGVVLVVEDDGPGLPDRDDLFDAFVSADPTTRHGSGLGLHIVREVVERWGGSVTAGRSASGGARFEVHLASRDDPSGEGPLPDVGGR